MSVTTRPEKVLLERNDGGILVEVLYLQDCNELWLGVSTEENHRAVEIPPEKALDAFEHPMMYVEDPHEFS